MKTDDRFDTDPALEEALRDLYARHEHLASAEAASRLLDGAYGLDAPAPLTQRRSPARILVPLAAAASIAAVALGGGWLDRASDGVRAATGASSAVLEPGAGTAGRLDPREDSAARAEERRTVAERELAIEERSRVEAIAVTERGLETSHQLAQNVLDAYASRQASGETAPLRGFSWLQPIVAGSVQDAGWSLSVKAERAETGTERCGMIYGVSTAESAEAVVVAAFAVEPLPRSDGSCAPPNEAARFVETRLSAPLGDRVVIDAATGSVLDPPVLIDETAP